VTRAVVFDLWDTLVDFDPEFSRGFTHQIADRLGRGRDEFEALWQEGRPARDTGPLAAYLDSIGVAVDARDELVSLRRDWARRALVPRPGAVETLRELRDRGLLTGLVSVCSDDVPAVWAETGFHGLFDSEVFSCDVGLRKPDPRIYLLACEQLGVEPGEALFVGDGANDELAGAERVGMRAVLIHREGQEPYWPEAREFRGPWITSVPEVLNHL
jgi:putative hydrolase of the HAD superfamily